LYVLGNCHKTFVLGSASALFAAVDLGRSGFAGWFINRNYVPHSEMVANYLVHMWEPEPHVNHKTTLQTIGIDLVQEFGVCDRAMLVAVHYLEKLKAVFDCASIFTRDCSAQVCTIKGHSMLAHMSMA
jgi:hypothetical protein